MSKTTQEQKRTITIEKWLVVGFHSFSIVVETDSIDALCDYYQYSKDKLIESYEVEL